MKPSCLDRYVALDRCFFERCGWDIEINSSIMFKNVEEQRLYLRQNQTATKLFMSSSVSVRSSAVGNNEDEYCSSESEYHGSSSDEEQSRTISVAGSYFLRESIKTEESHRIGTC